DEILKAAAGLAGDFVVTVAGPNVESLIAGRGSGAAEYSRQHFTTVTNVDIGGGSANSAVFRQGALVAAAAMNFGGRVIEFDPSGAVRHITRPGELILEQVGLRMRIGDRPDFTDLVKVCDCMAGLTLELIEGTSSPLAQKLYLTPPAVITARGRTLMLSGGIGRCYFDGTPIRTLEEVRQYHDVGPLLAERMRAHPGLQAYPIVKPPETMRATVLGAASQLVTLSGSTIWAEKGILPLRNVPVIHPEWQGIPAPDEMISAVEAAGRRWDLNLSTDIFALAVDIDQALDYAGLVRLAEGLAQFSSRLEAGKPLIIIIQRDYAQSLGQTMRPMLPSRPLLVIDQVGLEEGDFIDIGSPLMDGRVVPLSVKTLVFYH
ncbi:MAG TPA: ethanolamine ammonia-lyase reactivating factor EutA, partial [Anaerolineaceae bacterium]|nr:ethanolamine ammonia-lyase reactivating factor EutA [Anaerolineaceae bacterium]